MSEYYMTVDPESDLYKDYFEWVDDYKELNQIFGRMQKKFGIETNEYFPYKDRFAIIPTAADKEKFKFALLKDGKSFRKSCEISKTWVHEVKHIKHMRRTKLFCYCNSGYGRLTSRLFSDRGVLYCMMRTEQTVEMPSWGIPMKASEFYKVMEAMTE